MAHEAGALRLVTESDLLPCASSTAGPLHIHWFWWRLREQQRDNWSPESGDPVAIEGKGGSTAAGSGRNRLRPKLITDISPDVKYGWGKWGEGRFVPHDGRQFNKFTKNMSWSTAGITARFGIHFWFFRSLQSLFKLVSVIYFSLSGPIHPFLQSSPGSADW